MNCLSPFALVAGKAWTAQQACRQSSERMGGDVVGLMLLFGIGSGECPHFHRGRPSTRSRPAHAEIRQHLVERFRIMNRSALRENVRAMTPIPHYEAKAAQGEIAGRRFVEVPVHRESAPARVMVL
jgi:hypothetical protein